MSTGRVVKVLGLTELGLLWLKQSKNCTAAHKMSTAKMSATSSSPIVGSGPPSWRLMSPRGTIQPRLPLRRTSCCVAVVLRHSSPGDEQVCDWRPVGRAVAALACSYALLGAIASPAQASSFSTEYREWKPRRHHRRLDELISDSWAQDIAEVGKVENLEAKMSRFDAGAGDQ
jgi:hypothetical protein